MRRRGGARPAAPAAPDPFEAAAMTDPRLPRFFVPPDVAGAGAPASGRRLALPPSEAHHAAHVLRLAAGDAVEVFDGRGGSAAGRIAGVLRGEVTVAIETVRAPAPAPKPALRLVFAVPKGKRLDWLLEKATELGAARLAPVRFARSVAGGEALSPAARRRWDARCISAAKQSRRTHLPAIEPPAPLDEALAGDGAAGAGIFGDTGAGAAPVLGALTARPPASQIEMFHIYVGPEGGVTEAERRRLTAAGLVPVRLGPTVLRTETAAAALLAVATAWRDAGSGAPTAQ